MREEVRRKRYCSWKKKKWSQATRPLPTCHVWHLVLSDWGNSLCVCGIKWETRWRSVLSILPNFDSENVGINFQQRTFGVCIRFVFRKNKSYRFSVGVRVLFPRLVFWYPKLIGLIQHFRDQAKNRNSRIIKIWRQKLEMVERLRKMNI